MQRVVLLACTMIAALLAALPAQAQQRNRQLIGQCMACHGEDGIAKDKDVPHLAGQNYGYLVRQMHDFQNARRPHKEMRVMSRAMTDSDIQEIADYYSSLPR
jgi:cytochrome c553